MRRPSALVRSSSALRQRLSAQGRTVQERSRLMATVSFLSGKCGRADITIIAPNICYKMDQTTKWLPAILEECNVEHIKVFWPSFLTLTAGICSHQ